MLRIDNETGFKQILSHLSPEAMRASLFSKSMLERDEKINEYLCIQIFVSRRIRFILIDPQKRRRKMGIGFVTSFASVLQR